MDCAILAIASTTPTALALLQRLVKDVVLDEHTSAVPWTIVNKYYTAEVNFLVHSLSSLPTIQYELVAPALLFIWNRGEPYRDKIRKLVQHASPHEVEVALAIRLSPTGSTLPAEIEDDQDIDAYLSSKGFEFVDVPDVEPSLPDRTGILGIPRIIDALSTIMWPSMIRQGLNAVQSNPGISSNEYHNLARLVGEKISGHDGVRMQREFEALERWLDEDDADATSTIGEDDAAPWSTVVTPGTLSPTLNVFFDRSRPTTPKAGFDDDFTSFISASPTSATSVPGGSSERSSYRPSLPLLTSTSFGSTFAFDLSCNSTPALDDHANFDTTHLGPDGSYKSLDSVSDFGDDRESVHLEEDIPSPAEIAATSRRIFGTMPLVLSPVQELGDRSFQTLNTLGPASGCPAEELDAEMADANLERFDLQSVLSSLQGLKEEIAGMPHKERRHAAARVALGLAYGLDPGPEESKEHV